MKLLFFMFLFISGLSLTQKRILFSIDSVTFYQTPKIFNYSDPVEDTSVTFYSEIDYYVLYDLDLNNNTISIYYNRQIFKYSITKKQINSDFISFFIDQKTDTESPSKYKIYLNEDTPAKLNYFYYDKNELLTFGFFSKNIKVLNCE